MNPVMIQQQRLIAQQRQAALMQQQVYGGGMPMGIQNMNAAQFAQLRQGGMQPQVLPAHLQQQHLQQGGQHPNAQQQQQVSNFLRFLVQKLHTLQHLYDLHFVLSPRLSY
jgi:hypothetical protein